MTYKLHTALEQLKDLPEKLQDEVAEIIIDEISWQTSFLKSQDTLSSLANEALEEYNSGKTKPLDV
ncbi:MAG: hypothetical protein K2Q22_02185 [Cytophagales bacterium]|nr:hypothetical protein [Cytophagales bacterium]